MATQAHLALLRRKAPGQELPTLCLQGNGAVIYSTSFYPFHYSGVSVSRSIREMVFSMSEFVVIEDSCCTEGAEDRRPTVAGIAVGGLEQ